MSYTDAQYKDFTTTVARFCESLDQDMSEILARNPGNLRAVGALAVLDCIDKIYGEVFDA